MSCIAMACRGEQRGNLGPEDGGDVGVGVLGVGGEIHRELLHLEGQLADLRRAAVAAQAEILDLFVHRRVHAPVLGIGLPHPRVVADECVKALGELRKEVRELLLGLDGGG
ncbi:MAG: hypothetical protein J6Y19_08160, partial [Kiritimatiellae bacterium]|nr:hypothetical protein [Kiritimatiellia bacterium]